MAYHRPSQAIAASDRVEIPVVVRHSSPLSPARRPREERINSVRDLWPTPGGVPPTGDYLVPTTWRDLMFAALSVGRDPTPWLTGEPHLAVQEIIARQSPMRAYCVRRHSPLWHSPTTAVLGTSPVFQRATEKTAKGAFGYRLGMTMAEWVCTGPMGLGSTTHAEDGVPPGARGSWAFAGGAGLADFFGQHTTTWSTWLVEAKAG